MSTNGLYIKCFRAIGRGEFPVEVRFEKGLNIVSGVSNTGKSYIFQGIDFMLGGKNPPDRIAESANYNRFELELEDSSGNLFVLERDMRGGDFHLYNSGLKENVLN